MPVGGSGGGGGAGGNPSTGGAGGNAGTGGSGGTVMPPDTGNSVLERNKRATRDGHFVQPTLTRVMAARMTQEMAFVANFAGNTWASPLYVENGPMNKGIFIAVTTGNDVFALDEITGAVVWMRNLGMPSSGGLGNINPLGILGTPVIDMTTRTIYVTATLGPGTSRFEVHALSVDNGQERAGGWPVIIDNRIRAGELAFDPNPHHSRGAMSLVKGIVYVPFGGRSGDMGAYHGWVIAIDAANPTRVAAWATRGNGGAIWAAGGMASDGDGVFATTGNANGIPATNQDSEAVVRISGMATLDRTTNANIFFPANWKDLDAADDDMGCTSPVVIDVPGATPSSYVVAAAKHGHMYFMNTKMMGGMAGQVAEHVAASATRSLRTALGSYQTAMGTHVSLTVDANSVCPGNGGGGTALMSVLVTPGTPITTRTAWCFPMTRIGSGCGQTAAPISTSTDGKNESIVWVMNSGRLLGVNGETGAMVYNGGTCTGVRPWTSPIAVKGRIVVSADNHFCAWSVR